MLGLYMSMVMTMDGRDLELIICRVVLGMSLCQSHC